MKKKGATLVFEQILLFVMGIIIFITCFSLFRSYETYFSEFTAADQFEDVNELIRSNIVLFSQEENTNSTMRVEVPEEVGNERYIINLSQEGITIKTSETGKVFFSPLSAINRTFSFSGRFSTVHGSEFLIYKKGNQIIIG
jgi:hypothetical protein